MKKLLLLSLGLTIALSSCTKNEAITPTLEGQVTFTSSINAAASRATDSAFEEGDAISVFAQSGSEYIADNVKYQSIGGVFTSENPIYTTGEEISFFALYPYGEDVAESGTVTLAADQSTQEAFEASDYLGAVNVLTTETCPELSFYHLLSAIEVNILSEVEVSSVVVNALTSVDYKLSSSSYSASGSSVAVTPLAVTEKSYKAVVAPQTIAAGTTLLELIVEGEVVAWQVSENISLEGGYKYICNLSVTEDGIVFAGDIAPWSDGGEIDAEIYDKPKEWTLADVTSSSTPEGDVWTFVDTDATAEDFAGLKEAFVQLISDGRSVELVFPNLTTLPKEAITADINGNGEIYYNDYNSAVSSLSCPVVTVIEDNAAYNAVGLESIDAPLVETIGANAFYNASIKSIEFNSATLISDGAFNNCQYLSSVSLPKVKEIGSAAFYTTGLTSITLPEATVIGYSALSGCDNLISVDLPKLDIISWNLFSGNDYMESVSCAEATQIEAMAFSACRALTTLNLPKVTFIYDKAFYGCTALSSILLPSVESIMPQVFFDCSSLTEMSMATSEGSEIDMMGSQIFFINMGGIEQNNNITLTVGAANSSKVEGNTLNASDGQGGTTSYTFKEILFDGTVAAEYSLADISATSVPEGNEWIITDQSIASPSDVAALNEAMAVRGNVSLIFPNLESVVDGLFANTSNLAKVSLPQASSIGAGAFYYSKDLTEISAPLAMVIGQSAFFGDAALKTASFPKVEGILDEAFCNCTGLETIELTSLISVGTHSFYSCQALKSLELPSAKVINEGAFGDCIALESVNAPEVESIGAYSFYECDNLETISFPKATVVGASAFLNCVTIKEVSMPLLQSIEEYGFYSCTALTKVDFPILKSIGNYAFIYCAAITSLDLPMVESIALQSFIECDALQSVKLASVKSIDKGAFRHCTVLSYVELPEIISLGDQVFADCNELITVKMATAENAVIKSLGEDLFYDYYEYVGNEQYITLYIGESNSSSIDNNVLTVGGVSYTFLNIVVVD